MTPPKTDGLDETYAKAALRIFVGPRDMEWHNVAFMLLDEAPDYGRRPEGEGEDTDVFEIAGRILGYCAGLIDWNPTEP